MKAVDYLNQLIGTVISRLAEYPITDHPASALDDAQLVDSYEKIVCELDYEWPLRKTVARRRYSLL